MNQPLCKRRSQALWTISSWTHLPSSSATMLAHAFSTPTKVTAFGHTPSCCICWNSSSAFCPWPHLTCLNIMVVQVTTSWHGILSYTLRASFMLLHLAYMWTKLYPRKTPASQPLWIICWRVCLPSWSAPKLAHALSTGTKEKLSRLMPFCCISWKSSNCLLMLSSFNISSKPPIPWKIVHL